LLLDGNIAPVRSWLTEHIHRYGKLKKPLEILQDVTGEGLNAAYLAAYLEDKYKNIYNI
jgi:carboxypeptidase Taq